jgi:hypothetical protein
MATPATSNIISAVFLVAGIAVMLFVHILVVFWALRRGLGSSRAADEERAEDGSCAGGGAGLTDGELDALPCYHYKTAAAEDARGVAGDCAVCLEPFEPDDRCKRLPRCQHSFHAPCVDSWLRKSRHGGPVAAKGGGEGRDCRGVDGGGTSRKLTPEDSRLGHRVCHVSGTTEQWARHPPESANILS